MAISGRLDPAFGVGQRRRCPTDASTGGENVHRTAATGSSAGDNLPARVGRQGGEYPEDTLTAAATIYSATTTNPTTITATKAVTPTLPNRSAAIPCGR